MCYLDLEPCEVFDERERRARKEHKCDCCHGLILKGQKYHSHFSIFENEITSEKICEKCYADREKFAKEHDNMRTTPGYTYEAITECYHESDGWREKVKWKRILKRMDRRKAVTP